jgi:DnaJ-class molecular chaperone
MANPVYFGSDFRLRYRSRPALKDDACFNCYGKGHESDKATGERWVCPVCEGDGKFVFTASADGHCPERFNADG